MDRGTGRTAAIRSKAGQVDDRAVSTADGHSRYRRCPADGAAGATWAGRGRDASTSVGIGAVIGPGFSGTGTTAGHAASGAIAVSDACASAAAAEADFVGA